MTVTLPFATNLTPELIEYALAAVESLYIEGYAYKKAGVIMLGLIPENIRQGNLFDSEEDRERQQRLMATVDRINARMGRETIKYAVQGLNPNWQIKSQQRSPSYTTSWHELPIVKASNLNRTTGQVEQR